MALPGSLPSAARVAGRMCAVSLTVPALGLPRGRFRPGLPLQSSCGVWAKGIEQGVSWKSIAWEGDQNKAFAAAINSSSSINWLAVYSLT